MKFSDLSTFVTAGFVALGYTPASMDGSFPLLDPGPPSMPSLLRLAPGRMVFLTLGGGAGLTTELLYDRIFISARVIGRQNDFADAEQLAAQLDKMFLQVDSPRKIGTARALYITRTGGAPSLLEKDASDRYHFSCSYITETKTGL